jgi:hypothetical protein
MLHDSLNAALAADRQRTLHHEAAERRLLPTRRARRRARPVQPDDQQAR